MSWNRVGIYPAKGRKLPWLVRWYGEINPETGKPRRYSKSFKTKTEADEFKVAKQHEIKKTGRRDRPIDETLQKLIDDFMRTKRPDLRPASVKLYEYTTERLLKFFGPDRGIGSIDEKAAALFMAAQIEHESGKKKLSSWTRAQILTNVRAIFAVALRWKLIASNPFCECDKPKRIVQKWHHLKPDEYLRLQEAAPDLRWRVFYGLAYTAGLRFGELFSLTWGDIDFERGHVVIENRAGTPTMPAFHVKDAEARTIPLPKHTLDLLTEWQTQAPEGVPYILLTADRYQQVLKRWRKLGMADDKWQNRFMVNNTRRSMKVHCRWAGIQFDGKFTIHTFRKSYGQNQANAGVPIKTLQYLMGHSDEKTTLTYYTQLDKSQASMSASATDRLLADAEKRLDAHLTRSPVPANGATQEGNREETVSDRDNATYEREI
jgi:integrase